MSDHSQSYGQPSTRERRWSPAAWCQPEPRGEACLLSLPLAPPPALRQQGSLSLPGTERRGLAPAPAQSHCFSSQHPQVQVHLGVTSCLVALSCTVWGQPPVLRLGGPSETLVPGLELGTKAAPTGLLGASYGSQELVGGRSAAKHGVAFSAHPSLLPEPGLKLIKIK